MPRLALSLLAAGVALSVGGAAFAQAKPQPLDVVKIDVATAATGLRATKIIGETVVNDANEVVGKVDDLILVPDGKGPVVILSVGGFLGVGTRLAAVPYESLRLQDKKLLLPGATKDTLKTFPEFKYAQD